MDLIEKIDRTRFITIFAITFVFIFVLGLAFYTLTVSYPENGLYSSVKEITPFTSMYFSVMTFTSTVYGDIIPIGFSQVLSIVESLFGLLILGIIISKIVSVRQQKITANIYSFLQVERLREFKESLIEKGIFIKSLENKSRPEFNIPFEGKGSIIRMTSSLIRGIYVYMEKEQEREPILFSSLRMDAIEKIVISTKKTTILLIDFIIKYKPKLGGVQRQQITQLFDNTECLFTWIKHNKSNEKINGTITHYNKILHSYREKMKL